MRLLRLERASIEHQRAVDVASGWLSALGFQPLEADYDIWASNDRLGLLIEVKSLGAASVRRQTISAIGQLAYYAAISLTREQRADIELVRVVLYDRDPRDLSALEVLRSEGIAALWINDGEVTGDEGLLRRLQN
jgi:hypothetical protein